MNDGILKLFCVHLNQDNPKKNTALKLVKYRLIKLKKKIINCPRNAIILDPYSDTLISMNDRDIISRFGIVVIDCSWEQTETIFKNQFRTGRKLPHLLAANSVNYGKWDRLSSAEALAASLILTGFTKEANSILSKFSWGNEFVKINDWSI